MNYICSVRTPDRHHIWGMSAFTVPHRVGNYGFLQLYIRRTALPRRLTANANEKDVKGLLFRKQPRTGAGFRLSEIGKAFQAVSSAYRT